MIENNNPKTLKASSIPILPFLSFQQIQNSKECFIISIKLSLIHDNNPP